jgi:GGDEF domain-containing protein
MIDSRTLSAQVESTGMHPHGMSYAQAQRLLVFAGAGLLGLIALVMYTRRVETVEVWAVLLFVPVFLALLRWNLAGGLAAAAAATVAYVSLRASSFDAVGASRFTGLIVARAIGFLAFGALGGWANSHLRASLVKLDLYDQIDDVTGLFNARYLVQATDLEMARAVRYRSIFAVVVVDFPDRILHRLSRRAQTRLLRELGVVLQNSVRQVDRLVHSHSDGRHRWAAILPETGTEGARIFAQRMGARVEAFLGRRGAEIEPGGIQPRALTYPEDAAPLDELRAEFATIDHVEHPEAPAPSLAP